MCNEVDMVHIFSHRAYFLLRIINNNYSISTIFILEYNFHVCSDAPNTFIMTFIIYINTNSEFVLIFPTKYFKGAK